jgi:hypothetical protein
MASDTHYLQLLAIAPDFGNTRDIVQAQAW